MIKTTLIVILIFFTIGCTDNNQAENTHLKIESLLSENDSLRKIITEISTKYIFDSITIRDIPNYRNTYELNSIVSGEIVFVGYNKSTNVIMVDSFSYNPKILYNPDTLEFNKGGFIYKTELNANLIYLKGILETNSKYGREYESIYNSTIGTKKN